MEWRGDPIESVLDAREGAYLDGHLVHLCSWSDVVKNDLRKVLGRDDAFVNNMLHTLIKGALDRNGRYNYARSQGDEAGRDAISSEYVRVQCLIAEWLCIYRSVSVYLDAKFFSDDEIDLDNFQFG